MTMGVYAVEHIPSGRVYIGSAVKIERRWAELRSSGRHTWCPFQKDWIKDGANAFHWTILQEWPDRFTLYQVEEWWLNRFWEERPGRIYNRHLWIRPHLGPDHQYHRPHQNDLYAINQEVAS